MKFYKLRFFIILIILNSLTNCVCADNFIRKIHTIDIPDAPKAYNASLIKYGNGYLMAYRIDDYKVPVGQNLKDYFQHIGIVELDKNFKAKGPSTQCPHFGRSAADPRLVWIGSQIYLIFGSCPLNAPHTAAGAVLCMSRITQTSSGFIVDPFTYLSVAFQNPKWEKNWVPFEYNEKLYLSYTIDPHVVITPYNEGICKEVCRSTATGLQWNWGTLRGGTPAVFVDDQYLGFFHSSKSGRNKVRYYYIGAYTFEARPPFRLTAISSKPLEHRDFYTTPKTPLTSAKVLFPCGIVAKENTIYVSYGENDGGIKVLEIDKKLLYKSLYPLNQNINSPNKIDTRRRSLTSRLGAMRSR